MADKYKKIMHKRSGKGGIHCDCCNKYHGKERKILNLLARRRLDQEDHYKFNSIQKEESIMKEAFYYLRDKDGNRKTTVALLQKGELIARGVAICNTGELHKDQFSRKLGRAIAKGRALKALRQRKSCRANMIKRSEAIHSTPENFDSKCEYGPVLTGYEQMILEHSAAA